MATVTIVTATCLLPYTPLERGLEFPPVPPPVLGVLMVIVALCIVAAEMAKKVFYRRW